MGPMRLSTRIWLAWQVVLGQARAFQADGRGFSIEFDYDSRVRRRFLP